MTRPRPAAEHLSLDPTSELWGEHRARYRYAARAAAGLRTLDVACGAGFGLVILRQAGACPIGVDRDSLALREARVHAPGLPLLRADADRLPLPDHSVDLVTSFETIEHVADAAALVRELRRVLGPGGHLVLSTPNRDFGPPGGRPPNPFHVREFTADELRDVLRGAFDEVTLYGQWPMVRYRYVPFRMVGDHREPAALVWKLLNRLPFPVKDGLAHLLSGRSFYPGETDYAFVRDRWHGAHALLAVAT